MGVSKVCRNIQKREKPCDKFYTPIEVCKKAVSMVDNKPEYVWYDPWKGSGNFYNHFPEENKKVWTEIDEGKDFFDFNEKVDVICSNPPFSMINKCIEKCLSLEPTHIILVLGCLNVTPKRIDMFKNYSLEHFHMFRVRDWFGLSYLLHFKKSDTEQTEHLCKITMNTKEYPFQKNSENSCLDSHSSNDVKILDDDNGTKEESRSDSE